MKIKHYLFLLLSFLIGFQANSQIAANYEVGTWKDFKTAAVSYTFDDNLPGQQSVALPLFDKYGYKVTFFTVTTGAAGANPNWANIKKASDNGHDISSHSVNHPQNLANTANEENEYSSSKNTIIQNVPSTKCQTIAYPNCNIGTISLMQKYFIAGRVCDGQIMGKTPSDFWRLSSIITGNTSGSVNTESAWNSKVTSAKNSGGWCTFVTHAIDNESGYSPTSSSELNKHLTFMNTNKADYWVGTFTNVAKYIKERNALNLTETTVTTDSLRITPTDNLDNTVYDAPITIRRKLPTTWTVAKVYQGTTLITSSIVTINNVKYVMFDVVPDKGVYTLSNANSSNNGCTTPVPTVTPTIAYDLGATSTPLSATGTSLKWYTTETGGTASNSAPTPSTATAGTTVYYVSQTLNNCEGPRAAITVTVVNLFKINKANTAPVIDGTIDAIWNNSKVLTGNVSKLLSGTVSNSSDLSGSFKALWDASYLYILADVSDDTKVNDSQNVYDDDAVEVYVDINNDKTTTYGANDVQYSFGWNDGTTVGALPSGRSVTGIAYTAVARTGGYIIEAKIPWATIQGTPAIDQLIGIDFMINDDDDNGTRDGKLAWNAATDNAWQDPSLFGTAKLVDEIITAVGGEDPGMNVSGILCHPNPFTNDVTVNVIGEFEYLLQSASGEIIYSGVGKNQIILGNDLSQGIYILKIKQSETSKVVKICKN